jgi:hypothetical protein
MRAVEAAALLQGCYHVKGGSDYLNGYIGKVGSQAVEGDHFHSHMSENEVGQGRWSLSRTPAQSSPCPSRVRVVLKSLEPSHKTKQEKGRGLSVSDTGDDRKLTSSSETHTVDTALA